MEECPSGFTGLADNAGVVHCVSAGADDIGVYIMLAWVGLILMLWLAGKMWQRHKKQRLLSTDAPLHGINADGTRF